MYNETSLSGIIGGAITPFEADFEVDWDSFESHLHQLAEGGLSALLINASMAEGSHLSAKERELTLSFAIEQVGSLVPVFATVYGHNTKAAQDEARLAEALGAQALLIYPHAAFGGEELDPDLPVRYFSAIAEVTSVPLIVFRTPSSLAPTFDFDVLSRLAQIDGVAAVKDSTGEVDFYRNEGAVFVAPGSPLKVLADHDPTLPEFLKLGVHGATVMSAVVDTEKWVELFNTGDGSETNARHKRLAEFARHVYDRPFRDFRARLKEALRLDGVIKNSTVRPPLTELTDHDRQAVAEALARSREAVDA